MSTRPRSSGRLVDAGATTTSCPVRAASARACCSTRCGRCSPATSPCSEGLDIHPHWDWSSPHPVVRLSFDGKYNEPGDIEAQHPRPSSRLIERNARSCAGPLTCDDRPRAPSPQPSRPPSRHHRAAGGSAGGRVRQADPRCAPRPGPGRGPTGTICAASTASSRAAPEHVRFVFVTGVSMFSKVSLFSGLNNLEDISLDPRYATVCGYREADLDRVFGPELDGLDREEIRTWYNGYHWRGGERVYNPYDVLLLLRQPGVPSPLVRDRLAGVPVPAADGEVGESDGAGGPAGRACRSGVEVRRGGHRHRGAAVPDRLPDHRGAR